MRYDLVRQALEFLEKPGDMITLQVPYPEDVRLVSTYIRNFISVGYSSFSNQRHIITQVGTVYFEVLESLGVGSVGHSGPVFLIPRVKDNQDWLEEQLNDRADGSQTVFTE